MNACTYCGRKTGGALACFAHRDLPAVDPFYSPDVPQKQAEPTETFRREARLDRLQPVGG